ncbi:MAG: hypothetical protein Q8J87_03050, partial [Sediminibacterium sp.]|nr:hypothetical protein [Sediminibacterium sp.]
MKKQQYVLSAIALILCIALYIGGKTVPDKTAATAHTEGDGHDHSAESPQKIDFKSILAAAKATITPNQSQRLTALENSVTRGDVKEQQI